MERSGVGRKWDKRIGGCFEWESGNLKPHVFSIALNVLFPVFTFTSPLLQAILDTPSNTTALLPSSVYNSTRTHFDTLWTSYFTLSLLSHPLFVIEAFFSIEPSRRRGREEHTG